MATASKLYVEPISTEAAEDLLFSAFEEHLDTLSPEMRHQVLLDLNETAKNSDAAAKTSA